MTRLHDEARAVLRRNDRRGSTIPSPTLYPHIWNWDAAFSAIGWATFDPPRALGELELLLAGRWSDGMVPHIIFDTNASGYEPGPRWYRTVGHPRAPRDRATSSLTQPPVAASALRRVVQLGGSATHARARALLGALDAWHRWFGATRDAGGVGVPAIIHPWESGWDNSPRWDAALSRVPEAELGFARVDTTKVDAGQRPTADKYRRYAHLIAQNAARDFAPPTADNADFLLVDVASAAILVRAERDLAWLYEQLGALDGGDHAAEAARARADALARAIEARLLDERGFFVDLDVHCDALVDAASIARYVPIYAGLGGDAVIDALLAELDDPRRFGTPYLVPSVARDDAAFDGRRYWRGPCWINVNWLLVRGLQRAGRAAAAARLIDATVALIERAGFREYYDPDTGDGLGAEQFSWSAALLLDLVEGA